MEGGEFSISSKKCSLAAPPSRYYTILSHTLGKYNTQSERQHSFIHLFVRSFIHSFIHTFMHSFMYSFLDSFVHSRIHSWNHSLIYACIYLSIHSFFYRTYVFIYLLVKSLFYLFVHSRPKAHCRYSFEFNFIQSFIKTHWCVLPLHMLRLENQLIHEY